MNTIILPGFSIKNKEWAEKTKTELDPFYQTSIHYWKHWSTGTTDENWITDEINSLQKSLPREKVNILAKSIGTLAACLLSKTLPERINKIILCGIPVNDIGEKEKSNFKYLQEISAEKILCIQNENDPHGNYGDITLLFSKINRNIKIISKPRADHNYSYPKDFINFLK